MANGTLTIADVGTGSGAIIITLAKVLPTIGQRPFAIRYYGTDRSRAALFVAKKNARRHRVKVNWRHGDLLTPLQGTHIDIVVANLPYLSTAQYRSNPGLRFEPRTALVAAENGLSEYRRLFEQINQTNKKPHNILCEIDPRQAQAITALISRSFPVARLIIAKDLAGHDRSCVIDLSS